MTTCRTTCLFHLKKIFMENELNNKVAFITGAAHGQGRASALALAREGVHILGFDIAKQLEYPAYTMGSGDELDSLKKEVEQIGTECLVFRGDVRNSADIKTAVTEGLKTFGRIDILFNNAGICAYGYAHELPEAEWDSMIDINLKGPWLVAREIIPVMISQRGGVIINNSSIAGLRGMNRLSHYAASKWGLTGLTKSWARASSAPRSSPSASWSGRRSPEPYRSATSPTGAPNEPHPGIRGQPRHRRVQRPLMAPVPPIGPSRYPRSAGTRGRPIGSWPAPPPRRHSDRAASIRPRRVRGPRRAQRRAPAATRQRAPRLLYSVPDPEKRGARAARRRGCRRRRGQR